jgi:hypothetical protein
MVALCPACHEVNHIGRACTQGRGDIARLHLEKVNGWTALVAARYVEEAFAIWRDRSTRAWSLDITALTDYGVDSVVNADPGRASAEQRSRKAAAVTANVRRDERGRA